MKPALPSQCLFRYRSLDGDAFARTKEIICESRMYFANPASFNDPFDCRPTFVMDGTADDVRKYFAGVYKRQAPYLDRASRRSEVRKQFKVPSRAPNSPEALQRFSDFYYENISGKVGLLCLTEKPDDILMWSHYGSSHAGVCLGFRNDGEAFAVAQPVHYCDTRPAVNPVKQAPEQMLDLALYTKAKHWEYEAEWRIVHYRGGPGPQRRAWQAAGRGSVLPSATESAPAVRLLPPPGPMPGSWVNGTAASRVRRRTGQAAVQGLSASRAWALRQFVVSARAAPLSQRFLLPAQVGQPRKAPLWGLVLRHGLAAPCASNST
jgi:hypothetical protein